MNKAFVILLTVFLFKASVTKAQITLDTIVPTLGYYIGYNFKTVQISQNETKYFYADTVTNTFSLYNMDWTPFQTNIAVPLPFNSFIYQCLYITRTLFDCESSNIEYLYTAPIGGGPDRKLFVMRTDGTQLLQLDSSFCEYCYGACLGGSDWVRPIVNTSAGAKMFVIKTQTTSDVSIYSLCGNVPTDILDFSNSSPYLKLYPNPVSSSLTFEINPPDNTKEYELVIFDSQSKLLSKNKISIGANKLTVDVKDFSNGNYFYSLCTKDKSFQTGKFILMK